MIVDKNDFFRKVTLALSSSLEINSALQRCFLYMREVFPVDSLQFGLWDSDSRTVNHVAAVNLLGSVTKPITFRLPEDVAETVENSLGADLLVPDTQFDPMTAAVAPYVENEGCSEIILSLQTEDERTGYLVVQAKQVGLYTKEHLELVVSVREPLALAMANALRHQEVVSLKQRLEDDKQQLIRELSLATGSAVIGADTGLSEVMAMVKQVAPLQSTVLLLGETGVGKEVIANALHRLSSRREGPFIKVNCGAIPETLIDSELFGHEKGAFSGAIKQKRGRFERAAGGTIFLDEIGELPPAAQIRLLRVLQNREIERVGGHQSIPVDFRVIAATHRNLEKMVAEGSFREDLWFRINAFPINIPPLRHRKVDIPMLLQYFLTKKGEELGFRKVPPIATGALEKLVDYPWPGNVRELENVVERALIQNKGRTLTLDVFTLSQHPNGPLHVLGDSCGCVFPCLAKTSVNRTQKVTEPSNGSLKLDDVLTQHIERVLDIAGGKVHGSGGAAELLGVNPSTLRNKMKKLGIVYGRAMQKTRN